MNVTMAITGVTTGGTAAMDGWVLDHFANTTEDAYTDQAAQRQTDENLAKEAIINVAARDLGVEIKPLPKKPTQTQRNEWFDASIETLDEQMPKGNQDSGSLGAPVQRDFSWADIVEEDAP